jgi:Na+/phosphate symporter
MGEETKVDLSKLLHDVNGLRQQILNHEILAKEREKKYEERVSEQNKQNEILTEHIRALTKQTDILTEHINDLNKLLFKNDIEPNNTLVARIQAIEAFNKMLNETRFKLTGSVATVVWICMALGSLAGIGVAIYNAFNKK